MSKNTYDKCVYPECLGNVVPGKTIGNLCIKHSDLLKFFVWSLDNMRVEPEESNNEAKES